MGKKSVLLSICIPTYNRARKLESTLQQLAKEIHGVEDLVEICVSDNGSTDDTSKVLALYSRNLPLIYGRNTRNLGYDWNILKVTSMARGKFIWYNGDDDSISEGAVKMLVQDVGKLQDIDAICLNVQFGNKWLLERGIDRFKCYDLRKNNVPLDIGAIGSICVRRICAENVLKGSSVENNIVLKGRSKSKVLHELLPTFIFLESLKKTKRVGLASGYGTIMSRSRRGPRRKLYIELLNMLYLLEVKKEYPWVKENASILKSRHELAARILLDSCIASADVENKAIFAKLTQVLSRLLEMEGRKTEASFLRTYGRLHSKPLIGNLVSLVLKPLIPLWNVSVEQNYEDAILEDNVSYALIKADALMDSTRGDS